MRSRFLSLRVFPELQTGTSPIKAAPVRALARGAVLASAQAPHVVVTRTGGRLPNVSVSGWPAALIIIGFFGAIIGFALRFMQLRRRAHRLSTDSAMQYRALFERNPCPMFVYDMRTLEFLQVNHAALALFGYTQSEFMTLSVADLFPQDLKDEVSRQVAALDPNAPDDITARMRRRDGTAMEVDVRGRPAEVAGHIARLVIVLDITERKMLEAQLRQSQKMEAVGRLAGGIAHDFNNILTVIGSYAGMLADDHRDDADSDAIREIGTAARRAAALTGQLLSFSRKQIVQLLPTDMNRVVADIEPMLRRVIAENIRLSTSLEKGLGSVLADAGQLEQVIMNLVVNASDAMPGGGSLIVETANVDLDAEYVRSHPEVAPGAYVMLAASDTGVGMDADTLNRIFEPFFTTKEPGKGTGIGLATTYAIVRQFGGHVWVYSELGSGTTFKIYLPRDATPLPERAAAGQSGPGSTRSGTVLLVEDDAAVRRGVRGMLARHGYIVLEASDGESGLAIAASHGTAINVVVTDLMMPGMNGREFATALTLTHPALRVVFTSGYTDDEVIRRGLVEQGRTFLQKPFTAEQLVKAIDALTSDEKRAGS
ncbi:MAG: ATP-binding protein [bacterium]